MSEGSGAARASHSLSRHQHDVTAGVVFIVIALLGPILALFLSKKIGASGSMIADAVRAGGYTLPMAAFGVIALTVRIRSPQDFYGGAILVGLALFGLWAGSDLPGMRGFAFGPGTAPRLFAYCLLGLGVLVALVGLLTDGPPGEPYAFSGPLGGAVLVVALIPMTIYAGRVGKQIAGLPVDIVVAALQSVVLLGLALVLTRFAPRGPVFITCATLIFAVTIRPLGLVTASFVSIMISASATHEVRWVETIIWAAVLTLFCSLLFPWGLNLPLQLWPRF